MAFLTVFGRGTAPDRSTLAWFPVVGAMIGFIIAAAYRLAHFLWLPFAAGVTVVIIDAVITGALHLDGLADSADGLLPHMKRSRRLEVMAEPDVGAFALVTVGLVLGLRAAMLSDPRSDPLALGGVWTASRTLAAVVPATVPYARDAGLATGFLAGARTRVGWWLAPAGVLLVVTSGWMGVAALAALLLAAATIVALARARIGGFTGDVLGAMIVVSETVAIATLVATPSGIR
ncbi:MAG: adenosylcobinamide-GDP ribazoletransferase [Acidimicrobiales bacterium]